MKQNELNIKIKDFLDQKRIAVVGVSRHNKSHPVGNLIYHKLKKSGHEVFAVNPHMQTFEEDPCYPDLKAIKGGVDGVVIITRPEITKQIVQQCHDAKVPRVWMHQGIPAKATSVSQAAVDFCHKHEINVIAGACPMMFGNDVDFGHKCMRWIQQLTGSLPT